MLMPALSFTLWVMPPNSSRSKVSLKLTTNNMFAPYANNSLSITQTQTEELTGVELQSKHSLKLVH